MFILRQYRPASTPPLPEHLRADEYAIWDSSEPCYDEDGFDTCAYTLQGSEPLTPWLEMVARLI